MAATYGAKRLTVGAHYGLRDWLAQRVTAVLMALYTVVLLVAFLLPGAPSLGRWGHLMAQPWMKFLTFVVLLAAVYHAWVGVRDIFMDYIKPTMLRLTLHVFALVWLLGCVGWGLRVIAQI